MCGGDDYVYVNEYERELVDMAERRLEEYNEMYVPLEAQQMADINRYRSDTFKQGSQDKSVTSARMQTPTGVKAGAGMDPGGGNMMLQAIGTEQQQGSAGAMGAMAGLQTAEDLYAQGTASMASLGRTQSGQAMQLTANMAQQQAGVMAAQKAAEQTIKSAQMGAAGSIAGLGTAYAYDSWDPSGGLDAAVSGASTPKLAALDYSNPIGGMGGNMAYTNPSHRKL